MEDQVKEAMKIKNALRNYTGSVTIYSHWACKKFLYTEGVKFLAGRCGAYWLIDEIFFAQFDEEYGEKIRLEEFQLWKLEVHSNKRADLICEDGNGNKVYGKLIPWTDFPLESIDLYFTNNTLLLPSEN